MEKPSSDHQHVEQILAIARVAMALSCVAAAWVPPSLPLSLVLAYAATSMGIAAFVGTEAASRTRLDRWVHSTDFAWSSALVVATGGPASPLFVLYLFCVLSAAFRWRLSQTLLTGAAAVAVMAAYAAAQQTALDLLIIRSTFVAVAATLTGLLAEYEKGRREQLSRIGELLAGVQKQNGFRLALKYLSGALLRLTGSETLLVAARELDTPRAVLWTATRNREGALLLTSNDIAEDRQRLYFFHGRGDAWAIARKRGDACSLIAIDGDENVIAGAECDLSPRFWQYHQHAAAIAVSIGFGGAWRGRVYLLRQRRFSLGEVRFVRRALCQLVPAIHNQYLLRRLRSRASAAERRRVARELHDGVIQSLVGLEMQTAALRRSAASHPDLERELSRLQHALADEARGVRDVMHQIRPLEAGPGQFLPALREMVERFSRETGIAATFYAPPHDQYVPPRAARELARTLQEALTNVRRHAGAKQVEVEFRAGADAWRLDIENDGRPFGFLGRLDLEELEARRLGPRVIKERVREMGGDLVIESSETAGVRLEISLPRPEGQFKSA